MDLASLSKQMEVTTLEITRLIRLTVTDSMSGQMATLIKANGKQDKETV